MRAKHLVLLFLILATALGTTSCHKWNVKRKQKRDLRQMENKQAQKQKEADAKYQEAVKRNASHQSKSAKKSMKRNYKKADRYNNHKKEFFLKRWFGGKKKRRRSAPDNS
ncbi:MAG: hypothetical protein KAG64_05655 [Bacteroidales bacterium]|nr:hypothetical protein [Bacteroidales bacterium]